jgi:hypothetical protein
MTDDETTALQKSKSTSGESADSREEKSIASSHTTQVVVYPFFSSVTEPAWDAFRFGV